MRRTRKLSSKKSLVKSTTENVAQSGDWKNLTIQFYRSLDAVHSQLAECQTAAGLAKPQRVALRKFYADLSEKKRLLDLVKTNYETGVLSHDVSDKDRALFNELATKLPKDLVVISSPASESIAKLNDISKYTDIFFSAGPHGPGGGRPGPSGRTAGRQHVVLDLKKLNF